tara:strand:+ start:189 stop:476 length:288 start_codon:yes stop_codon:yes gene_type:complete
MQGLEHRGCRSEHMKGNRYRHFMVFAESGSSLPIKIYEIHLDDTDDPTQRACIGFGREDFCGRSARKILNRITPAMLNDVKQGTLKLKASELLKK